MRMVHCWLLFVKKIISLLWHIKEILSAIAKFRNLRLLLSLHLLGFMMIASLLPHQVSMSSILKVFLTYRNFWKTEIYLSYLLVSCCQLTNPELIRNYWLRQQSKHVVGKIFQGGRRTFKYCTSSSFRNVRIFFAMRNKFDFLSSAVLDFWLGNQLAVGRVLHDVPSLFNLVAYNLWQLLGASARRVDVLPLPPRERNAIRALDHHIIRVSLYSSFQFYSFL